MKKIENVIIKHGHSNKCFYKNKVKKYCPNRLYFGNRFGNERKQANYHYWIEVVCNSPDCKFKAALNSKIVDSFIKV